MKAEEAIDLIKDYPYNFSTLLPWADLGCGSGTFTLALAALMKGETGIVAIDKDASALKAIPDQHGGTSIKKLSKDFLIDELQLMNLGGILMANALHYVQHKKDFIGKLKSMLNEKGVLLLIEYDMEKPNPWVPYPLSFHKARTLLLESGFAAFEKINERPSSYHRANMYSAAGLLNR